MIVLSNLGGGGAERIALLLMRELANRGHAVTLFAFKREGALWNDVPANVRVRAVLAGGETAWPHTREIWRALTAEAREHDVVIGALEGWPTLFALGAARRARKPCIGWVHADYRDDPVFRLRFLWTTRLLDRVVCVSAAVAAGIHARDPRVIYNAVPALPLQAPPANAVPTVLAIGRLARVKRFELLVDAAARIDAHLAIVGDGPERAALERRCARLGVAIEMPGYVADLAPWYERADVVVSCSRSEGFSLVVAEALARGIPVIATRYPAAREVLDDGRFGDLVDANPDALAAGIERLLADRDRRQQLRRLGPERAADFAVSRFTARWDQLIAELV
jgi:glycosyltransferase involved in cell wall biosynthesis